MRIICERLYKSAFRSSRRCQALRYAGGSLVPLGIPKAIAGKAQRRDLQTAGWVHVPAGLLLPQDVLDPRSWPSG